MPAQFLRHFFLRASHPLRKAAPDLEPQRRTRLRTFVLLASAAVWLMAASASAVTLGAFTFDPNRFGDTVTDNDGGALAASSWLNTVDVDPGVPGVLTGADFETGVANLGLDGNTTQYTIGYGDPIPNVAGDDLGIVVARFSTDSVLLSVSLDGISFSPTQVLPAGAAVATGATRDYFFPAATGGGPFPADLFVMPVDLSSFGVAPGQTVAAIRIADGGDSELDLVRVAGFAVASVPEPAVLPLLAVLGGAIALRSARR